MEYFNKIQMWFQTLHFPVLLLIGIVIIVSFYFGKAIKVIKLPLIIGYMGLGVIFGPSFLNLLNDNLQNNLSFITEMALGFVALGIGLELSLPSLKKQGLGIISIIFAESFGAFISVFFSIYILTGNIPLALIFGAIAPASAPAGTVAVIQEYKAKGSLTKALYAVVGFDDGLGIIIFGFVVAVARSILSHQAGAGSENIGMMLFLPFKEILLSFLVGYIMALIFCSLARKLNNPNDILILVFGFVLLITGICLALHLSLILTNMIVGIIIINTQSHDLTQKIHNQLKNIMPILFILFFTLAGAHLHIKELPGLGIIGIVYFFARSFGLIGGSRIGAALGHVESKIKKYIGLGILSQAGVAIGLSLIVKHEFKGLGKVIDIVNGVNITSGDKIGAIVLTTITATCIIFEIIGPILTKVALMKANEIDSFLKKEQRLSGRE